MSFLWHVALPNVLLSIALASAVAVVCFFARRPALAHGLWLLVLLKSFVPPLVVLPIAIPAWLATTVDFHGSNENVIPSNDAMQNEIWLTWALIGVWIVGSSTIATIAIWRVAKFRSILARAQPAPPRLIQKAGRMAKRMGLAQVPEILFIPGSLPPMVWGLGLVPRIYLPIDLLENLSVSQRGTLLVHELAHLLRGDHLVRWVELAATICFWWHPVVWWARREMRVAEEQCCDAWVVDSYPAASRDYADAILETLDFLADAPPTRSFAALGVSHVGDLANRLTLVMQGGRGTALSRADWWWIVVVAALTLPLALRFEVPGPTQGPSDATSQAAQWFGPEEFFVSTLQMADANEARI